MLTKAQALSLRHAQEFHYGVCKRTIGPPSWHLALADVLAADNRAFDRARFIEACETGTTRGMRKVSA